MLAGVRVKMGGVWSSAAGAVLHYHRVLLGSSWRSNSICHEIIRGCRYGPSFRSRKKALNLEFSVGIRIHGLTLDDTPATSC